MNKSESEIWKSHPEYTGIEVSSFGRVRSVKGHYYANCQNKDGYMRVGIPVDGKQATKLVHRLVAQVFIQNPNNWPEVNHKDNDRANNRVENLEFCTPKYNSQYREKYGISRAEVAGRPVYAVNLKTHEVSRFKSQIEAGQALGVFQQNINAVIKGKRKQANGFLFVNDDGNGIEIDKDKLNDIVDGMYLIQGVYAVNLTTLEVLRFQSQSEAGRELGVKQQNINDVLKGKRKTAHGYWFVNDDGHAVDIVKSKLHDIGKTGLKI